MTNYLLSQAVLSLRPNSKFVLVGESYAGLEWLDEGSPPSEADVMAKAQELENNIPLEKCKRRAKELITFTDWSVLPDVGLANTAEFETYRAALRELIKTPVADPVWPTEPEPVWS